MSNEEDILFDFFDRFTPHLRIISLGGIRIHEGAWTALEVQQQLSQDHLQCGDHLHTLVYHDHRTYLQLNNLRLTWDSSLVGMCQSLVGILLLDARYTEEWIKRSAERAIEDLFIWHNAYERQGDSVSLQVFIWIEEPADSTQKIQHSHSLEQALGRVNKVLNSLSIQVNCLIRSSCLDSKSEDMQVSTWQKFLYALSSTELITLAEMQKSLVEQTEYIDSWVLIPAGTFYQGGPPLSSSTEKPKHQVKISKTLWVSQTPITRALWKDIMGSIWGADQDGMEPIVDITWYEALRFCNRLSIEHGYEPCYEVEDHILPKVTFKQYANGYRLLTESEWEYVCLGGVTTSLTAPPPVPKPAWTQQRAQLKLHPVAQLEPNPWGLYDCLGNIAEWCQDLYEADVYSERKQKRLVIDPCVYTGNHHERVVRGGAFDQPEYLVTASHRDHCRAQQKWSTVGFRVARQHENAVSKPILNFKEVI